MLAGYCTETRRMEVREVEKPRAAAGEVIVRVRHCGICGSDLHFFCGGFPPPPVCPGHEIAGEVAEVGAGVSRLRAGDRVAVEPLVVCGTCDPCRTGNYQLCPSFQVLGNTLDGGFAEFLRVPPYALFTLPDAIDFEVGSLTEPLAVAVHALRLHPLELGDRVLILGAGTIGLMAVAAARAAGAGDIWTTARHPQQAAAASSLGATRVFVGSEGTAELSSVAHEQPVDLVVETVGGHADTLNDAVHLVRRGGTVVVLGIFSTAPSINALAVVIKEVRLIGSMTYGRSGTRADFDRALALLAQDPERFRSLITHRFTLAELQKGFETAADKGSGSIKVTVRA